MGRKRKQGSRGDRRADKVLRRARLKSRVIVAEATAQAAETRAAAAERRVDAAETQVGALVEAATETQRIRAEAMAEAARIVADGQAQADYVVAQARVLADAETETARARAELQAERLLTAANVALEQARAEIRVERERAESELTEERTRLRDQALLESARIRDDARSAAHAEVVAAETERERILADAHAEAFAIVEQARSDAASEDLWVSFDAVGALDDGQPMLAVDEPVGVADSFSTVDAPPFASRSLTAEPVEQPSRGQAIEDLTTFWEDEVRRKPASERRRLLRRGRRS